jgi:tetratricopeptide (TPR) repeat protein
VFVKDRRDLTASLGLGIALNRTFAYAEAEPVLDRALALSPRNTTVLSALADALFGQRRYAEATELYRRAAADALERRKAESRIVICLLALGRMDQAQSALAQATARDPGAFRDLTQRVAAYRAARAAGEASDSLRVALARAAAGVELIAEVDRLLQRPMSSERYETQRLELLTLDLSETGRPREALETLHRLQRLRGATYQSRIHEAGLLLDLDRPAEALALYDDLLASGTLPAEAQQTVAYRRAVALVRLDRDADAIEALRAAADRGFRDTEKMLTDPDLFPLRTLPAFRDLVEAG